MNTLRSIFFLACFSITFAAFAQAPDMQGNLKFSFQKISDQTWGVFVLPDESLTPSSRTTMGTGQVTLVAPVDFTYANLENKGGTWVENARVNGPVEAFDKAYISFGFVTDNPKLNLFPNEESLLFTLEIDEEYEGMIALFENGNDPFSVPNSFESNPGNDITVIDYGTQGGLQYYSYAENYHQTNRAPSLLAKNNVTNKKKAKAVFASDRQKETVSPNLPK